MAIFIFSVSVLTVLKKQVPIPGSDVATLPLLLIPVYIATMGPETVVLYFAFFISAIFYFYFYSEQYIFRNILYIYCTFVALQSVYALTTTFSPIPSFHTTHVRAIGGAPVSIYAFSGGKIYLHLAITVFISSYILARYRKWPKKLFSAYIFLTGSHLFLYVLLTGTGRTGMALLFAFILFTILYVLNLNKVIPLVMISPVLLWVAGYGIYVIYPDIIFSDIFRLVNDFTSNRSLLYIGGIDIVVNNIFIIREGGYTLSDLFPLPYPASLPQTTHNILINTLVDKGILVGTIFTLWLWKIGKVVSVFDVTPENQDVMLASTIITGYLFTGLFVGGAIIFNLNNSVIWWIFLAYVLTALSS
ncbi:hypothetical protein [Haloarcula sp. Atlit-7R]|uniref:hypothetical protein n=1 Tax=Haloarcula sp. Atlit-7R TaxID=2282125 RepID=UPI0011C35D3B|nr:hypothetical protein [Haloarcula sp. Atlit-7R]